MAASIQPIVRKPVTEVVYQDLKERILGKEYTVGEKLPGEIELAQNYGVSRNTIRAALQKLSTLGVVDIRVGEGTFVKPLSFDNLMHDVSDLIATQSMSKYLTEFREDIESICLRRAAVCSTAEDAEELFSIAEKMKAYADDNNFEGFIDSDYRFHAQLCRMSHNELYEMVYASIKELFVLSIRENVLKSLDDMKFSLSDVAGYHLSFAASIRDRNFTAAQEGLLVIIDIDKVRPKK